MTVTPSSDRTLAARLDGRGTGPDLRDRQDDITGRVVAEMTRTVPAFTNAPEPFLDVVAIVVGRIVEQALTLIRELRTPTRAEVRELVEVCVPSTDQGVTLEDMLRVFCPGSGRSCTASPTVRTGRSPTPPSPSTSAGSA